MRRQRRGHEGNPTPIVVSDDLRAARLGAVAEILARGLVRLLAQQVEERPSCVSGPVRISSAPPHSQAEQGSGEGLPLAAVSDESVHVRTSSRIGLDR